MKLPFHSIKLFLLIPFPSFPISKRSSIQFLEDGYTKVLPIHFPCFVYFPVLSCEDTYVRAYIHTYPLSLLYIHASWYVEYGNWYFDGLWINGRGIARGGVHKGVVESKYRIGHCTSLIPTLVGDIPRLCHYPVVLGLCILYSRTMRSNTWEIDQKLASNATEKYDVAPLSMYSPLMK